MPTLKAHSLIDTTPAVASFLDKLVQYGINKIPNPPAQLELQRPLGIYVPRMYFDAEGNNLGRHGTLSILQVYVLPLDHVYLIDVTTLKGAAFDTPGKAGLTLRMILEDPAVLKVFFDVRGDSDALHALHSIELRGIHDLQLMQLGTLKSVDGLSKLASLEICIRKDTGISTEEQDAMAALKRAGKQLFRTGFGVFDERPLKAPLAEYCVQDVQHMATLWTAYANLLTKEKWARVLDISRARVNGSQSADFTRTCWNKSLVPVQFWSRPGAGQQWGPFY
ncbi:hypothetical protein W97_01115 [Coniosporium apollinis CBS 100218]|uniref:3'-5' exonuclease domain-containing protein n=1 Tax=Coniosporium apollinis (strain CBS 100218) TaxID=1168221 RepID=R7YIZ3_CONA1|nr:uncharacterized protein W97_01115 [Coniosporium apollinis CBS 100218]EON61897.1 hypothetical protein W97_01115 [Coniosporium apollinis CBS 100218]